MSELSPTAPSHKHVTKAAGVVGLATVVTRILGFVRDAVIAAAFGTGMAADAFYVAFRIPNTLRRFVGEGALTVSFIPVFVEERHHDEEHAWAVANAVLNLLASFLLLIIVLGMLFSPALIRLIAPGFDQEPGKFDMTITLTRLTFPYIFFVSLAALAMGILNSVQHFLSPALAPAMLNLAMIGSVLFLCPHFEQPVIGLAIGVTIGGLLHLLFQTPALFRYGFRYRLNFNYQHPAVQKIGKLLLPGMFGVAVYQIGIFVSTILASYLQEGTVSALYYSNRLIEFPLGIFGMAIATAVLPTMSAQVAKKNVAQLTETLSFALRLTMFITIPAMVGLMVLRTPIVTNLFQRGAFNAAATQMTAEALLYYLIGLPAIAGVRIIVPVFYALKDTATPVKCAALAVAVNIGSSVLLMGPLPHEGAFADVMRQLYSALPVLLNGPLQHKGLAFATSFSSMFNLILLVWLLRKRLGAIGWKKIALSIGKVGTASVLMGGVCAFFATQATQHIWMLFVAIGGGMMVFLGGVYVLKSEELLLLKKLVSVFGRARA